MGPRIVTTVKRHQTNHLAGRRPRNAAAFSRSSPLNALSVLETGHQCCGHAACNQPRILAACKCALPTHDGISTQSTEHFAEFVT
jgi:hypothetical protein